MKLNTMTWNIGGGMLLTPGADPNLLASYRVEGLDEIVETIRRFDPDIITLQEVEGNSKTNQIAYIANQLGLQHFFYDPTSDSHIDSTQSLGNGIISKFPISDHRTGYFHNPNVEFDLEGKTVSSHEKGYGQCLIDFNGHKILTTTLHLLPFVYMGIKLDSMVAKEIYKSISTELRTECDYMLIQGDFNIDSNTVREYLGELFNKSGLSETIIYEPTTPKGRKFDHILFKGVLLHDIVIDSSVSTDHYPVICTFQIPE